MIYEQNKLKDMIPDYLNNALSEKERMEFEHSLQHYPELKKEVREFSHIKTAYASIREETPSPSEAVFKRVMNAIRADQKIRAVTVKRGFIDRIRDFCGPIFISPRVSWAVVGVQLAVILVLLMSVPKPGTYTTLTQGQSGVSSGNTIQIVFDSETKEIEIRNILNRVEGKIISGPSSKGLYTIRIKENRDITRTLKELKKYTAVRFAEKGFGNTLE